MNVLYKVLFIACLLFHSQALLANKGDFHPGYIIKKNGSKQRGQIMQSSLIEREIKVYFIPPNRRMAIKYKPSDLKGYAVQLPEQNDVGNKVLKWVHYESRTVSKPPKLFASKEVFVEKELEGEISLFRFYYEYRADIEHPYRYLYYVQTRKDDFVQVDKDNFKKVCRQIFKEYTALHDRVGKAKFQFANLNRMIQDYNYWLKNKHDRNTYRVAISQD